MRSDIGEVLPAAGAFLVGGLGDDGGKLGASGDLEVT